MESAAVVNILDVSFESADMSPALCFSSMALAMVTESKCNLNIITSLNTTQHEKKVKAIKVYILLYLVCTYLFSSNGKGL